MDWYIPILIALARVCDVSIGTVRMILIISGKRWIAAVLGFFEVIIWALAVGGVVRYLSHPLALVAYGAGFAMGTLLGMAIEDRLALGYRTVRVINADRDHRVTEAFHAAGMRATRVDGVGRSGPVEVAFLTVRRRDLKSTLAGVQRLAPNAFVTVERADRASGVDFPPRDPSFIRRIWSKRRHPLVRK
ncbi:MAG: hypothetical protein KF817_04370 [Phycisphaeraceae bacterium]|nr:hypothetical protein [Phycisphaeraceae bacterium]